MLLTVFLAQAVRLLHRLCGEKVPRCAHVSNHEAQGCTTVASPVPRTLLPGVAERTRKVTAFDLASMAKVNHLAR